MRLKTKSGLSLEVVAVYSHRCYKSGRHGLKGSEDWAEPDGSEKFSAGLAIRSFAAELSPPIPQSSGPGQAQLVPNKGANFTDLADFKEGEALTVDVSSQGETLSVRRLTEKEAMQRVLRHSYRVDYRQFCQLTYP